MFQAQSFLFIRHLSGQQLGAQPVKGLLQLCCLGPVCVHSLLCYLLADQAACMSELRCCLNKELGAAKLSNWSVCADDVLQQVPS